MLYLDANNLYGWAMSQKLPTGDFKWEESNYNWRNPPDERGCIIECDLEYPLNTKFKTQKFPLAPEKLKIRKEDLSDYQLNCLSVKDKKIGNVSKLILNLKDKEKYVIHYELLKYYEKLGLKVKKKFTELFRLNKKHGLKNILILILNNEQKQHLSLKKICGN